jgi:addiction module HigA family antidote
MKAGRKLMSVRRKGTPNWKVHPGEILREEFLKPMAISPYALAKRLRVPPPRINDIVLERRGITADTALRLSRFFGTTELFWLNLQGAYDIGCARSELAKELEQIEPLKSVAAGH